MKIPMPTLSLRRRVIADLEWFFNSSTELTSYNRAVGRLAMFYEVKLPKTTWHNSSDMPMYNGECTAGGELRLIYPDSWKKRKAYNTCAKWINTVLHEMGHFILWVDHEDRANQFASRMVRGTVVK